MKIGIVGSGKIGGVVGTLWAKAGHTVLFSSRHPEPLDPLVVGAGPNASRGTVEEAIVFAEVVFLSIPSVAVEAFGRDHRDGLTGKVAVETGNPYPERDGAVGNEVRESGLGWVSLGRTPLGTGLESVTPKPPPLALILRASPPEAWNRAGIVGARGEKTVMEMLNEAIEHAAHHPRFVFEKRQAIPDAEAWHTNPPAAAPERR